MEFDLLKLIYGILHIRLIKLKKEIDVWGAYIICAAKTDMGYIL